MSRTPTSGKQAACRVLIAGVGNVLRGDDGFGPAVIRAFETAHCLPAGAHVVDVGTGGLGLVHELMEGYDVLVLVDAVDRGGAAGTIYTLVPEVPSVESLTEQQRHVLSADMHEAVPDTALVVAQAAGVLPPVVRIIGCQPLETEDFAMELSPPVQDAVPAAMNAITGILEHLGRGRRGQMHRKKADPTQKSTGHGTG